MRNLREIILDFDTFKETIGGFAEKVPKLLTTHPETVHLALEFERLKLREGLNHQFTVAVVGRMKSGKSTLLNTLLDTDKLAVGIDETTATVNWVWHGTGDQCKYFRVYWRDGRTERKLLEEVGAWTGENLNVSKTKYLEFFVDSPLLKVANFVDTPGTQSNKPGHEETTRDFIAARLDLDEETVKHGGFASAILYVFGAVVGKESNAKLLELCGINTRLPGSLPTNSIAVVQKWDQEGDADQDPLVIVAEHCEKLKEQFREEVSEVLATSPPLAIAAKHVSDIDIWDELAKTGAGAKSEDMRKLLSNPESFSSVIAKVRKYISPEGFPGFPFWPVVRFSIRCAHSQFIDEGKALREAVKDASGIDRLKSILETRFLDNSNLLHTSTILAKLWGPCEKAQGILRDIRRNKYDDFQEAIKLLKSPPYDADGRLKPVRDLLVQERRSIDHDVQQAKDLMEELSPMQEQAKNSFDAFETDINCLKTLVEEADWMDFLNVDDIMFLQRLFGRDGKSLHARLGLNPECELSLEIKQQVEDEHYDYWCRQKDKAENLGEDTLTEICAHAVDRLEHILIYMDCLHEPE